MNSNLIGLSGLVFFCAAACAPAGEVSSAPATTPAPRQVAATTPPPPVPVCAATRVAEQARGEKLGELEFLGGVSILGVTERIGGLSGLEAGTWADGAVRLIAIADDGHRLDLAVEIDAEGGLGPISCAWSALNPAKPNAGKRNTDAEGLAELGDGRFAVSYERDHRIEILGEPGGEGPAFTPTASLAANQGLEALARLPNGSLIAGGETPDIFARPHPVWRFEPTGDPAKPFADSAAPAFSIATEPGYGLTSFDVAPDGSVILLKRFWTRRTGAIISVERLAPGVAETASGIVRPESLARLGRSGPVPVDNFEGVAAHEGPDGSTWIWMIADDNFNAEQMSYLYIFRWSGGGEPVAATASPSRS